MKTGIQIYIVRHDFWIPTYVGMTKRLKNSTYDTKPLRRAEGQGDRLLSNLIFARLTSFENTNYDNVESAAVKDNAAEMSVL